MNCLSFMFWLLGTKCVANTHKCQSFVSLPTITTLKSNNNKQFCTHKKTLSIIIVSGTFNYSLLNDFRIVTLAHFPCQNGLMPPKNGSEIGLVLYCFKLIQLTFNSLNWNLYHLKWMIVMWMIIWGCQNTQFTIKFNTL